jgi:hypothetical protein
MTVGIVLGKGVAWHNRWLAVGISLVAAAMIAVASLPGLDFLQPRWMFPVGILVAMTWIVITEGAWRHVAIGVILATNLIYLLWIRMIQWLKWVRPGRRTLWPERCSK